MKRWIENVTLGLVGVSAASAGTWLVKRLRGDRIPRKVLDDAVKARAARRADAARKVLAPYVATFVDAGRAEKIRPEILMSIAMRETNGTNIVGDGGHGHGMMQIDDRSFPQWTAEWRAKGMPVADNIRKGAAVLASKRDYIDARVPGLSTGDLEYASVAAYNTGEGNVSRSLGAQRSPDATTTGGDYAAEVLEIARLLGRVG